MVTTHILNLAEQWILLTNVAPFKAFQQYKILFSIKIFPWRSNSNCPCENWDLHFLPQSQSSRANLSPDIPEYNLGRIWTANQTLVGHTVWILRLLKNTPYIQCCCCKINALANISKQQCSVTERSTTKNLPNLQKTLRGAEQGLVYPST